MPIRLHLAPRRVAGVTLVEIVLVLVIVAILAGFAAPSFKNFIDQTRVSTASNALLRALALTRNLAVTQNRLATVCPSADGRQCSEDWSAGWRVYATPTTGSATSNPDASVHVHALSTPVRIYTGSKIRTGVTYNGKGVAVSPAGMANGTFTLCAGTHVRQVVVSVGGRASLRTPDYTPALCEGQTEN